MPKSGHNSCIMFQSKTMRDVLFGKLTTGEPYTHESAAEVAARATPDPYPKPYPYP